MSGRTPILRTPADHCTIEGVGRVNVGGHQLVQTKAFGKGDMSRSFRRQVSAYAAASVEISALELAFESGILNLSDSGSLGRFGGASRSYTAAPTAVGTPAPNRSAWYDRAAANRHRAAPASSP